MKTMSNDKPKLKKFFWVKYLKDEKLKQRLLNKITTK